jgi:gas vesicle protein
MATKVIYGTLIGACVGGTMAVVGNILRDSKIQQNREAILKKYPILLNYTFLLNNLVKIYEICSEHDFETLCADISNLIQMEQENSSTSLQANRISEKCIKKFKQIEITLRNSKNVNHRQIADDIDVDEFSTACRDIIHNMLLKSPKKI